MDTIRHWAQVHPELWVLVVWPTLTAIVTFFFQARTPDELATMPKWAARALLFIAATGLDSATLLRAIRRELGLPSVPPPAQDQDPGDLT